MDQEQVAGSLASGFAAVEASIDDVVEAMTAHSFFVGWTHVAAATGRSGSDVLEFLDTVTWPATRLAVFRLTDGWTKIVNNQRGGSEVADLVGRLSLTVPGRVVRVADRAGAVVEQNGFRVRTEYEARIVELFDEGESIRSISCADDGGRWSYDVAGEPLPIEAEFDDVALRRRDRFTRTNLHDLLRSIGVRPLAAADLLHVRSAVLITATPQDEDWANRVAASACSTAEAADPAHGYFRRGVAWAEHIETHATSVVADLGKAILLDPGMEPQCRDALDRARRQLGRRAFDEALQHAERGLTRV